MENKFIKELLSTGDATEGQLLIVRKIFDTLIAEVDKNLIPRSEAALVFGPGDIPGSSIDVDLETPTSMAVREIGEGADIPLDTMEYTNINFKPVKWGVGIRITNELMEDGKWNLLQMNIGSAGKRFAENENKLVLTALDGSGNDVSGGAALTISNITEAMLNVEDNDFEPTSMFIGNEALQDIRNIDTFVEADKLGSTQMISGGFVGRIYGMNVIRFSTNAAPTSTHKKYAYVIDKGQAYGIAEKRPVSVENFSLPSNDMSAASVTQRIVVKLLRSGAVSRITTS